MPSLNSLKVAYILFLLCAVAAISSPAQTLNTLVTFHGNNGEGANGPLVQGTDGNFYGTTALGGATVQGTVFRLTPDGVLTTIHDFCSETNCSDGNEPLAGLVMGLDGNFYGTTISGGANTAGTVFKITLAGNLTVLHSFVTDTEGFSPKGMVLGTDGNFYGVTQGSDYACSHSTTYPTGCGTIFKITPEGTLTVLHIFNGSDGDGPSDGLIQATSGNFYGTTANRGGNGFGTVFEMTSAGKVTTLYSFCAQTNCTDGEDPGGGLVQAANGNFYGTTSSGGGLGRPGTLFEITPAGVLTTLYSFCPDETCAVGNVPDGSLVQGPGGSFYGTTSQGGPNTCGASGMTTGCGTIFRMTPDNKLTTVHSFDGTTDGSNPSFGLVLGTDGHFYGMTFLGGDLNCGPFWGCGTLFKLTVGLGPFVKTVPTSAPVGREVRILGTDLTGATSVKFNATAAKFTVVSATQIIATVPKGATTGKIHVTTPSRTLSSNVVFRVP